MYKRSNSKVVLGVIGGLSEKVGVPKSSSRLMVAGATVISGLWMPAILGYAALYYMADDKK